MKFLKKIPTLLFSRTTITALILLLDIFLLFAISRFFYNAFTLFFLGHFILALIATVHVINRDMIPEYKISWIITIFFLPIAGLILYMLFSENRLMRKLKKRMSEVSFRFKNAQESYDNVLDELDPHHSSYHLAYYLSETANNPLFRNRGCTYFPGGEDFFESLVEDLKRAERFIFLEFFIIEQGYMWNTILDILIEKVKAGVDVRLIYDDVGCLPKLPRFYDRELRSYGIKVNVFNPIKFAVMPKHNNRDHRKIVVIDGCIGYTGGSNLADEYINEVERFGHWKESTLRITGEAVYSLTVMFLSLWSYYDDEYIDFRDYMPRLDFSTLEVDGYVQPFNDSPLDNEAVAETVYMNAIYAANRYIYITTPYLVISRELENALCNAAKSGIDVRIITPRIPDKKLVFLVTRSHYRRLIENGVRIFEYMPGFIHAKNMVSDDQYAVVGTINLDYRSMYLHFECGVWIHDCECVGDIYKDFLETQAVSKEITLEDIEKTPLSVGIITSILQLFAPYM